MKTNDLPDGKFRVILADPCWQTKTYSKERSGTPRRIEGDHYPTLPLEELKKFPVGELADSECALIMWVIDTHLAQAFELAAHWGFEYSSIAFVWRKMTKHGKTHFGMGKTTRKQVEIALLFKKAKMPLRQSAGVRQYLETEDAEWIDAKVREHSRKPDEVYGRIESLYKGPYCELFARQHRPNWTSWGNEVGKFDKPKKAARDIDALLGGISAPKRSTKSGHDDIARLLG